MCLLDDEYYDSDVGRCKGCSSVGEGVGRAIGIFIAVMVVLAALWWLFEYPERVPEGARDAADAVLTLVRKVMHFGPRAKLKVRAY